NIFINKYVMSCAISIVIALVGYISMSTLPVEQYPDIAPPTVTEVPSTKSLGEAKHPTAHVNKTSAKSKYLFMAKLLLKICFP
ncbi:MAG: efflux RND transporter permease subunit, partial [Abditibacteriota bacterium]|nr:efflux RND transporter permease subunit [Abditibacteriota bacterium]